MRRCTALCLVAVVMLAAGSASAQWYAGVQLAGVAPMGVDYYDHNGYRTDPPPADYVDDGLFDYASFAVGYSLDAVDLELGIGFGGITAKHEADEGSTARYPFDYEDKISWRTISLAGYYKFVPKPDPFSMDAGLRFTTQSYGFDYEEDWGSRADWEEKRSLSGWSLGPVLRARYFFADGALALGPEIYMRYSSFTDTEEIDDDEDEVKVSGFGFDYSIRLDFMFY